MDAATPQGPATTSSPATTHVPAGGGSDNAGSTAAELLARVEELTRRIEWLEATVGNGRRTPTAVSPDVVLAISAAVAAYLGKRATVRQVHLRRDSTWAKQGRAQVMASHGFAHGTR